jgi:hypothetical protein
VTHEYTWDEPVVWPNGDSLVVSAPKYQDRDGTPQTAWTVFQVTVTNAGTEGRRASDQAFDAETDGRKIKPIIPDVDGRSLFDHPLPPGRSFTYSFVFATAMLGERLTMNWRSGYAQHQPNPTISGPARVQ